MGHSNQKQNTGMQSASTPNSTVDGRLLLSSSAEPAESELKHDVLEDDRASSGGIERQSMPRSFHSPSLQRVDVASPAFQTPNRPLPRGLFDDRHPLSIGDVLPPWYSVKSLNDLILSYLPMEDYLWPVQFRPMTEYLPGGTMSLVLTDSPTAFHDRCPQYSLLRSLHQCVLFMPPPVAIKAGYGVEFDANAKLRSLPSACFKHLNVLYIVCNIDARTFRDALLRLYDLLKHVKILIIQFRKARLSFLEGGEILVFDMRNTKDCVAAVINTLWALQYYAESQDVNELLDFYARGNEDQVLLMEAVLVADEKRLPHITHLLGHPLCRWLFETKTSCTSISDEVLSNDHLFTPSMKADIRLHDAERSLRERHQLNTWHSVSVNPPKNEFVNDRLSHIYWFPRKDAEHFTGFAGLPNLHYLQMHVYGEEPSNILSLADTRRLSYLHLGRFTNWEVDVGPNPVYLDVLHLEIFEGVMTNTKNLVIRDFQANGTVQPNLVHLLCRQAENVRFVFDQSNIEVENEEFSSQMFSDAKHLRCGWPDSEIFSSYSKPMLTLFPVDPFDRLESLQLDNFKMQLFPSLFPVLRKLTLEMCHVLLPPIIDEETKEELPQRLHFEYLEECTLLGCRIDRAQSEDAKREASEEDNPLDRIHCAFSAPNLVFLRCYQNHGSATLYLNETSCPQLGTFQWAGSDFVELPFDVEYSLDTPMFPKLHSLSLCVSRLDGPIYLPFARLAQRLSIEQVSHLSLLGHAYICELDKLELQCQWAHFSQDVLREYFRMTALEYSFMNNDSMKVLAAPMLNRMPHVEVLMLNDLYIVDTA